MATETRRPPAPVTLPELTFRRSPNFSTRHGQAVHLIVVHRWGGGSWRGVNVTLCDARRPPADRVSAHLNYAGELGPDRGRCAQLVGYGEKAWHCRAFNAPAIGVELADAIWTGADPAGFERAARIVAFLLQVNLPAAGKRALPARWIHGAALLDGAPGFTRHFDLGAAGGGHTDPTTDPRVWARFVAAVEREHERGGFRPSWGHV